MSLQNQQAALGPHPAASVAVFLDLGVSTSDIARYFGVRQEELPVELLPDQNAGARSGFQMEFEFEGEKWARNGLPVPVLRGPQRRDSSEIIDGRLTADRVAVAENV